MTARTLEDAIAQNHGALDAMLKGDSTGYVALLSDRDDVTWGNPFGPFARGRERVEATLANAATRFRGGEAADSITSRHTWPKTLRSWSKWNTGKQWPRARTPYRRQSSV